MTPTLQFLTALGQALAALSLYASDHPMRVAAVARVRAALTLVLVDGNTLRLSFLDGDVIAGSRPVTELRGWDWGARLSAAGVQRLEVQSLPTTEQVDGMLIAMRSRLTDPTAPSEQWTDGPVRLGPVTVVRDAVTEPATTPTFAPTLSLEPQTGVWHDELDAIGHIHAALVAGHALPVAELELVLRALLLSPGSDSDDGPTLVDPAPGSEYLTTHACNVATLSMRFALHLGLAAADARAIGAAALLADIGMACLPDDLRSCPDTLTADQLAVVQTHPGLGARLLTAHASHVGLAATVAYEHHRGFDATSGYPQPTYARRTHYVSRIVQTCDVFNAACALRPYRTALGCEEALALMASVAGSQLDPDLTASFAELVRRAPPRRFVTEAAALTSPV